MRLHVFLNELHRPFKDLYPAKGQMSGRIRELVAADLEGAIMILDKTVLELIELGDFEKAVELLLPALHKFREKRLADGQKKLIQKLKKGEDLGKKKGGVETQEAKAAQTLLAELMKNFVPTTE